jgi:hypothetical protein
MTQRLVLTGTLLLKLEKRVSQYQMVSYVPSISQRGPLGATLNVLQEIHSKLHRHVKNRLKSIETGKGLDWATAEARFYAIVSVAPPSDLSPHFIGTRVWIPLD